MNHSLSPIQDLFKKTWHTFTKNLLNIFLFNLIGLGAYLLVSIMGFIALFLSGIGLGVLQGPLQASSMVLFGILLILFLLAFMVVGVVWQVGLILIIDRSREHESFKEVLRSSWKLVIPVIVIQILVSLLTIGGFFLLIIPGIILSVLFSFALFEVVLNNKKGFEALRASLLMVGKNFWGVAGRLLILSVISLVMAVALKDVGGLLLIVNILLGWFGLVYSLTIYQEIKSSATEERKAKMLWVIIVSILGWIILGVIFYVVIQLASSGAFQDILNSSNLGKELEKSLLESTTSGNFSREFVN